MSRTLFRTGVIFLGLLLVGTWVWLADHARPRHETFTARRGSAVEVAAEEPVEHAGGFVSQAFRLQADSGLTVAIRVLRPSPQVSPLPPILLLAGHRTGRDAVGLVGHPGATVMVALDYPYHAATAIDSATSALRSLRDVQQALLDTPPATSLVLDWLESQDWADAAHSEIAGISFGVPFAAAAGALDTRFQRVWLIHGGAGNRGWIEHNLPVTLRPAWLRRLTATVIHLLIHGASFDTAAWAGRISPRPVVIVGARGDDQLPEHKVIALYNAASPPKELIWTEGGHVHPRRPEIIRALLDIVRARQASSSPEERPAPY